MQIKFIAWIILAAAILSGCKSMQSVHLTNEEWDAVMGEARQRLIASEMFSEEEVHFIRTHDPEINYYMMARPYADYRITWDLNEDEEMLIAGQGDILQLEGSSVTRRRKTAYQND